MEKKNNHDYIEFRKQLGKRIQQLRKQHNLSQEDLAAQVGVDRVYIGYVEQGIRSISLGNIFAITKALNINPKDLFDLNQETK